MYDSQLYDFCFSIISDLTKCKDSQELEKCLIKNMMRFEKVQDASLYQVFNQQGRTEKKKLNNMDLFWFQVPKNIEPSKKMAKLLDHYLLDFSENVDSFKIIDSDYLYTVKGRIGVYQVLHLQVSSSFDSEQLIANIIEVYSNIRLMLDTLTRDVLTSLPNRQAFNKALEPFENKHTFERRSDRNTNSVLALIDLDNFKNVNDKFGHLMGDEILIHFSHLLSSSFRYTDFSFRYGGEEFALLLNDIHEDNVEKLLNRFMQKIRSYKFPVIEKLTITIGYTCIYKQGAAVDFIAQADSAMYYGKLHGRDSINSWQKLITSGLIEKQAIPSGQIDFF